MLTFDGDSWWWYCQVVQKCFVLNPKGFVYRYLRFAFFAIWVLVIIPKQSMGAPRTEKYVSIWGWKGGMKCGWRRKKANMFEPYRTQTLCVYISIPCGCHSQSRKSTHKDSWCVQLTDVVQNSCWCKLSYGLEKQRKLRRHVGAYWNRLGSAAKHK